MYILKTILGSNIIHLLLAPHVMIQCRFGLVWKLLEVYVYIIICICMSKKTSNRQILYIYINIYIEIFLFPPFLQKRIKPNFLCEVCLLGLQLLGVQSKLLSFTRTKGSVLDRIDFNTEKIYQCLGMQVM